MCSLTHGVAAAPFHLSFKTSFDDDDRMNEWMNDDDNSNNTNNSIDEVDFSMQMLVFVACFCF